MISPNLLKSDELYDEQIKPALEQRQERGARVIPIIVQSADEWKETGLKGLRELPRDGKAVFTWTGSKREEVTHDIAIAIGLVISEMTGNS